jgi:hypothetical protein
VVLALLLLLTGIRVASLLRPHFAPGWDVYSFYDFRLMRANVEDFVHTGQLYDTSDPAALLPGSGSSFKYPPTFAAILRPFVGRPQAAVGRAFLFAYLALLAGALVALLFALRPAGWRGAMLAILFLNWQPLWESMADLQLEILSLFFLALFLARVRRGRSVLGSVPLGVAGAFKLYPWLLLVYYALRRRWKVLVGAAIGAALALGFGCLLLPPRLTVQFFFSVLPHLGGTSLSYENLSGLATFSRAVMEMGGALPSPEKLDALVLEQGVRWSIRFPAQVLALLLAGVLLFYTVRAWRRGRSLPAAVREPAGLALSVCLLLMLIPTSWLSYQTLLAIPLLTAAGLLPMDWSHRRAWLWWGAAAAIGSTINSYTHFYDRNPALCSLLRCLIPLFLWLALTRLLRTATATTSGVAPGRFEA